MMRQPSSATSVGRSSTFLGQQHLLKSAETAHDNMNLPRGRPGVKLHGGASKI
jgi:hypothetical protein